MIRETKYFESELRKGKESERLVIVTHHCIFIRLLYHPFFSKWDYNLINVQHVYLIKQYIKLNLNSDIVVKLHFHILMATAQVQKKFIELVTFLNDSMYKHIAHIFFYNHLKAIINYS